MISRSSSFALVAWSFTIASAVAACTGDDEIYAPAKDGGGASDGSPPSSSSGSTSSSSGAPSSSDAASDASSDDAGDAAGDAASDAPSDASDDGATTDSGVDSGPLVCSAVVCASNATCLALGCGSCNMGQGKCKP